MATKTTTEDIPFGDGSGLIRGRVQRTETVSANETAHGPESESWGDYTVEQTYDNEDSDNPRHELTLKKVGRLEPGLKVVRYQNQDPEKSEIEALVKSRMFREVEFLDMKRNFRSPSDDEWGEIVASGALAHLRFLGLQKCYPVGNATIRAIASGAMPKLEALDIGVTEVSDEGLMLLADSSKTPALQVVQGIFMKELSEEGVEALSAARPGLALRFEIE